MQKNKLYYARIDILKFFATVLIILFHFELSNLLPSKNSFFFAWLDNGITAVTFFFVLSGFLHTLTRIKKQKESYKDYLLNRVVRLIPMYLFVLFFSFSIHRETIDSNFVIGALFLNVDLEIYRKIPELGPLWIIAILAKFYFFFPFIFNEAKKNKYYLFLAILLTMIMRTFWFYSDTNSYPNLYFSFIGRLEQILLGMFVAFLIHKKRKNRIIGLSLSIGSITLLTALFFYKSVFMKNLIYGGAWGIFYPLIETILWSLFISGVMLFPHFKFKNITLNFIKLLGKITYPMLMLHIIVITAIKNKFGYLFLGSEKEIISLLIVFGIIIPITMGLGTLAHFVVESPFQKLKK